MKRIEVDDDIKGLLEKAVHAEDVYIALHNRLTTGEHLGPASASEVLRAALRTSIEASYDTMAELAIEEDG